MAKLVIGCGYLGTRVAERWQAAGQAVYVATRSTERAEALARQGYRPLVADVTQPNSLKDLPVAETVLYAVGFDRTAGPSLDEVYVGGLAAVLAALPQATGKLIYISSTGVYGQDDGSWIDEESPCQPRREGGCACLAAEQLLHAHPLGDRAIVLRLAGIYGPGRVPRQGELLTGQALAVPSAGYLNLIHVDDAAHVVLAAEQRATPPRTYVVSDGQPVLRADYYAELAHLLRVAPPQFTDPPAGSPAAQRAAADKRICNRRMQAELAVPLTYPTYREGLAAILGAEG